MNDEFLLKRTKECMSQIACESHGTRIKIGIIKSKLRRISEYYANGEMSKEDFDRKKSELKLKLSNI